MPEIKDLENVPVPSPDANIDHTERPKRSAERDKGKKSKPEKKQHKPAPITLPAEEASAKSENRGDISLRRVEEILSANMDSVFLSMDAASQQAFKQEGEKTALEIKTLISKTKTRVRDIIKIITKWLKLVPNINKFFLEQEAKIKANAIMKIYRK